LVTPFIIQMDQGGVLHSVDKPMPTITSADAWGLCEPFLLTTNWHATNRSPARSVNEPVPTIIGNDSIGLAQPYLVEYYGTGQSFSIDEPMKTLTARDRFALVEPIVIERDGKRYLLDFKFRMLQPHELARAMSFPDSYRFKGTREQIVKQIGNAVPKNLAKALAKSLLQ
jgi:DNA (cytosine-5)-methyltransferase 1